MERILRIHDHGLTVIILHRNSLQRVRELRDDDRARRCLRRWLARDRRRPVRVLADLADETLHEARVPRVGMRDRGALYRRTAARHFGPDDHCVVHRLARDREGERLRIAGVPAGGQLDAWLSVIGEAGVTVSAIHSAALVSEPLLRAMGETDSPTVLTVIRRDRATVRQGFHRDGRVVFSRCAPVPRGDHNALAREVARTLDFVRGRQSGQQISSVRVLVSEPGVDDDDLRAAMPDNVELRSIPPEVWASRPGGIAALESQPPTPSPARLAQCRGDYPLPGVYRLRESCRRSARLLNALAAVLLVAAVALALWGELGERRWLAESEGLAAKRMALTVDRPLWLRDGGGEIHAVAPVVDLLSLVARHLPAQRGEPGAAMARVGAHLPADGVVVDTFAWRATDQDEEIRVSGSWALKGSGLADFEDFVRALEGAGRWQEVTIERVPGTPGNTRRAGNAGTAIPAAADGRFALRLQRQGGS